MKTSNFTDGVLETINNSGHTLASVNISVNSGHINIHSIIQTPSKSLKSLTLPAGELTTKILETKDVSITEEIFNERQALFKEAEAKIAKELEKFKDFIEQTALCLDTDIAKSDSSIIENIINKE